jgi:hypothetical protein
MVTSLGVELRHRDGCLLRYAIFAKLRFNVCELLSRVDCLACGVFHLFLRDNVAGTNSVALTGLNCDQRRYPRAGGAWLFAIALTGLSACSVRVAEGLSLLRVLASA